MSGDLELNDQQIKHMVDRFLSWKLPADFAPDGGIVFDPIVNLGTEHQSRREPVGTNLFTATQAEEMVRHMVAEMSAGTPGEVGYRAVHDGPGHKSDLARAREVLRQWHRDTCYPDAMSAELEIGIDSLIPILCATRDAEIETLTATLLAVENFLVGAPIESDLCCCGGSIREHGLGGDHSPVDAVAHRAEQLLVAVRAPLSSGGLSR